MRNLHQQTYVPRYWRFENEEEHLDGNGFFAAPDSANPSRRSNSARPSESVFFSFLSAVPCLILLGEPGMGKTTALEEASQAKLSPDHERLEVNLNGFSAEGRLLDHIFKNPKFEKWQRGECNLHLWLDSLDECLLSIKTIGLRLGEDLKEQMNDENSARLHLRIACRSAAWPRSLQRHLEQAFGEKSLEVVNLCPLTREDVATLATAAGVDAFKFLEEVERHAAGALAARPITLKFLLSSFKAGDMAKSRDELFRRGCLHLCEEANESRRETRRMGALSPARRLEVAARLAALTVFCGKPFLWHGASLNSPDTALTFEDILGERNGQPNQGDISASDIEEVLDTPLFNRRDAEAGKLFSFAHRTYAEFLAAYHLYSREVPTAQTLNLLKHSDPLGSPAALVPQLTETAAWLALYDLNFEATNDNTAELQRGGAFRFLIETDPGSLLRPDVAFASDAQKVRLARALVEEMQAGHLTDRWNRHNYLYLNGAGLDKALEPFIVDGTTDIIARRAAIDIVEACPHAFGLADTLAKLALDETEDINARIQAAYAVMKIGRATNNAALLKRLQPLAVTPSPDDKDDELKGVALQALWPEYMSASEFFALITPPQSSLCGAYRGGVLFHAAEHLCPADLLAALHWCAEQDERVSYHEDTWELRGLIGDIVSLACDNLGETGVARALAKAIAVRLEFCDIAHIWKSDYSSKEPKILPLPAEDDRRAFLTELVALLSSDDHRDFLLQLFQFREGRQSWVISADLDWILERAGQAPTQAQARSWSVLTKRLCLTYGLTLQPEIEKLFVATKVAPALAREVNDWFEPIEIGSERAKRLQNEQTTWDNFERQQLENQERQKVRALQNGDLRDESMERMLAECESGKFESWWQLDLYALAEPHSHEYRPHFDGFRAWKNADESLRARLLKAAELYLRNYKFSPAQLDECNSGNFDRPALAAYRALLLLFLHARPIFDTLPQTDVAIWATLAVGFPLLTENGRVQDNHNLLRAMHDRTPQAFSDAVIKRIDSLKREQDHYSIFEKLDFPWSETLLQSLLNKADDPTLSPSLLYGLLKRLLLNECLPTITEWLVNPQGIRRFNFGPARRRAELFLKESLDTATRDEARAQKVALALLAATPDGGWPCVWPAMQNNPQWGREVMLHFASQDQISELGFFIEWMPEDSLADWYLWLSQMTRPAEEKRGRGVQRVTLPQELGRWRDNLPTRLQLRATPKAVRALERIVSEAQNTKNELMTWVKYLLPEARRLALANTWIPPKPSDVAALLRSPSKRFVSNGDELLDVIIESLERFNAKLQGETPAAPDLWDASRPKDENAFSDRVKRHLEDDIGKRYIVVNREVEVRRGESKGEDKSKGERTDIWVQATAPRDGENEVSKVVSVIIEAKGEWNPELFRDMENQLRDRYLKDNACQHGLYLVGWFQCDHWDKTDSNWKKARKRKSLESTQKELDDQAFSLSLTSASLRAFVLDARLR